MSNMINVQSQHSVADTAQRFIELLTEKGLKLFAHIDHAAGAASIGKSLRPTQLIIFGNPAVGTPLMEAAQSVALDLPQKVLVYEDESGSVFLGYDDPQSLVEKHGLDNVGPVIEKIQGALAGLTKGAAS